MDRYLLRKKIEQAFADFKSAIKQHPNINIKRADGGWSISEIADHIVKSTQVDLGTTQKTERPYDQHAPGIRDLFLNFQLKFKAASILQPDPQPYSINELLTMLDRNHDKILKTIEKDDLTELCVDIHLPVWGILTKYEWIILFENHIIRHTKQVNDFYKVTG